MPRRRLIILAALALLGFLLWSTHIRSKGSRTAGPLNHSAYIWQRNWSPAVSTAVIEHGPSTAALAVLSAEVSFDGGRPEAVRTHPDFSALAGTGVPTTLAIRIGPFAGPFSASDATAAFLVALAKDVLTEARAASCQVAELQLDFDCPTSKLPGYRRWLAALKTAAAPIPLSITALPAWLSSSDFAPLAAEAGHFVLQVHSLESPRIDDASASLCNVNSAEEWADRAGQFGVPFTIALPTYGYTVVYGSNGKLVGIIAEAEGPSLAQGMTLRELRADPVAMVQLVNLWQTDRPASMRGVIWYRLPVEGDRLNWSWPTLAAVMRGSAPSPLLRIEARPTDPLLTDVFVRNDGDGDASLPTFVDAHWAGPASLFAHDALSGMQVAMTAPNTVRFTRPESLTLERLRPGEARQLGWIRLTSHAEIHLDAVSPTR